MHQSPEVFDTPDLYLTAYLKTLNLEPVRLRREGDRTYFVFLKNSDLEKAINSYIHDDKLEIKIKSFIRAVRDTKYLIYHPTEIMF